MFASPTLGKNYMTRLTRFAVLVATLVVLVVYGPANAKDPELSKLAHQTRWEWNDHADNPLYCMLNLRLKQRLGRNQSDYGITLMSDSSTESSIRIAVTRGTREVYSWVGHSGTIFDVIGDTLYYVNVCSSGSVGGLVHAVDLKDGELLWKTRLRGMGPTDHSAYSNRLAMRPSGTLLYFFGRESQGDYIEVIDLRKGKTVSHRVVPPSSS